MAHDNKYGKVDILGIPADEPVFILRAKDRLAVDTIKHYERLNLERAGLSPDPEFLEDLEVCISNFETWASDNADKMKMPD